MPAPKGNQYAKGNKGGPGFKPIYKPKFVEQAKKACEAGFTNIEMADLFGVSENTIHLWAQEHKDFGAALKMGKDTPDDRVERSLYHKAIGYSYDAVKIFQYEGSPVVVPYREHVPPDTTACIFWLKNRRRNEWRDVHKHEHGQPGDFDKMNADELANYIRRETEELGVGNAAVASVERVRKPGEQLN